MGRQKVFGLGLSKTGTQSLAAALNSLGVKTKHHPIDRQTLDELKSGEYRLSILNRYDGLVDTPVPPYYAQLDVVYPGSKFILTTRDKKAWLSSAERHWRIVKAYRGRNLGADRVREFVLAVVYGTVDFNPDRFSYVYDTHERNVRQYFEDRPDDLLILNITGGEGWEKLCGFLELEIPQMPFPHKNKRRVRGDHHVSQDTDPGEAPISIPVRRDFDANASLANASQEEIVSLHHIIKEHHAPGIQLSMGQIYAIGSAIRAAAPGANVLIFGCGRDSELWNAINFDGHTVFLENDPVWLDRARSGNASLHIEEVSYGDRTVASSLPIDEEALSAYPVPEPMLDRPWDVILIDAPPGHKASAPGRSLPIYWCSKVAQAETQIFIDDYDRRLERAYSDHFFGSSRPWTMIVPRMVYAGKPSNSSLLWVLGVESAVQDAAMTSRIPGLARETSSAAAGGTPTPESPAALRARSSSENSPLVQGGTSSIAEETTQSTTGRRAIVVYVENKLHLIQEVLGLRQSWLYTQSPDTDLVVMGPADALALLPDDLVKIVQQPAADDPAWRGYRRVNSITCFNGAGAEQLDDYSHIMRTDIDTFITPAWNQFYPTTFTHGKGGYSNGEDVRQRLRNISAEYGLVHRGMTNVGMTWYGPTQLVRRTCAFAEMIAKHIITQQFAKDEGKWPGWYRGVSVMYSGEIAVNHCAPDAQRSELLEITSTSTKPITDIPHIHCYHTNERFSKFKFRQGEYTQEDAQDLDVNIIRDYCLAMALQSLEERVPVR